MSEYFTPDPNSVFVGFEYEAESDPRIPLYSQEKIESLHDLENFCKWYKKDPDVEIRVPYLTVDRIVQEGGVLETEGLRKGSVRFTQDSGRILHVWLEGTRLSISEFVPANHDDPWSMSRRSCIFDGECRDINTFRTIRRLLSI